MRDTSFGVRALRYYLDSAIERVALHKDQEERLKDMSATVAVVLIDQKNRAMLCAHMGDTRVYFFRRSKLQKVTKDHSLVQQFIDAGFWKPELLRDHVTAFIAASVLLIGCATEPVPVPVHQETAEERAQKELNARTEANDAGVIWSGDKVIQVEAYKYLAFSYCVTSRQALCKQQFEKALKLDPTFELGRGEKGHPLWGPVFEKAKNTK